MSIRRPFVLVFALWSNPSALSEYEIGIRIVPFDAPPLANPDNCNCGRG